MSITAEEASVDDTETSESRRDPYRTSSSPAAAASSTSRRLERKESSSRNTRNNNNNSNDNKDDDDDDQEESSRGQRHRNRNNNRMYGQPRPLLGIEYEYENEDPLKEARDIGEIQYSLLTEGAGGEGTNIERPVYRVEEEETTTGIDDDTDDQLPPPPHASKSDRSEHKDRDRKIRMRKEKQRKRRHRTSSTSERTSSPSRQENVRQRYPTMQNNPYLDHGLADYGYEVIPDADDISPSYFDDGHHDYGDSRHERHAPEDHDYDEGALDRNDPSDHHEDDHHDTDHHQNHNDDDKEDDDLSETTSHTLTLTGKNNIPIDMRVPYAFHDDMDPREKQADDFLNQREKDADRILEAMKQSH